MKVLLYEWEAYGEWSLRKGLKEVGLEVVGYSRKIENHLMDEAFLQELVLKLVQEQIFAVISFDFFPLLSMACQAVKIPYLSWVFGAPHYSLYCDIVKKEHNFIFCFDRMQANSLRERGVSHAYHLPLAADIELFENTIKSQKARKADISFVGNLYTDKNYYFEQMDNLPEYVKGYVEGLCEAQLQVYGCDLISGNIPSEVMGQLAAAVPFHMDANYFLSFEQFMIDVIQKKVTVMERQRLLQALSQDFNVTLYTHSDTKELPKVHNGGYIHYYKEMPLVFAGSDINLNISLRSILTGIPLRVLDVAACGGFLISNYQEELAEHFVDGEEVVLFTDKEDLWDKCAYYLKHDTERKKIASKGYGKVKRDFTYRERILFMLEQLEKEMG